MLEGILNHLMCGIVEDEVGFILANVIGEAIMFLHTKENYIRCFCVTRIYHVSLPCASSFVSLFLWIGTTV
jgi:hypothetical protein